MVDGPRQQVAGDVETLEAELSEFVQRVLVILHAGEAFQADTPQHRHGRNGLLALLKRLGNSQCADHTAHCALFSRRRLNGPQSRYRKSLLNATARIVPVDITLRGGNDSPCFRIIGYSSSASVRGVCSSAVSDGSP